MALRTKGGLGLKKKGNMAPKPMVVVTGYIYHAEVLENKSKGFRLQLAADITDDVAILRQQVELLIKTGQIDQKYEEALTKTIVLKQSDEYADQYNIYPSKYLTKEPSGIPVEAGMYYKLTLAVNTVDSKEYGPSIFLNLKKSEVVSEDKGAA